MGGEKDQETEEGTCQDMKRTHLLGVCLFWAFLLQNWGVFEMFNPNVPTLRIGTVPEHILLERPRSCLDVRNPPPHATEQYYSGRARNHKNVGNSLMGPSGPGGQKSLKRINTWRKTKGQHNEGQQDRGPLRGKSSSERVSERTSENL